jgi:hypothetical protein
VKPTATRKVAKKAKELAAKLKPEPKEPKEPKAETPKPAPVKEEASSDKPR